MSRIITFTTDFGLSEHYVGAMKGVVLNINSDANLVDISNSVRSFDLLEGALTIAQAYRYYPTGTIHLVIVDPGVGSGRRPILVDTGRYLFIAPDNGVLSFVYEQEERVSVRHITASHYFLEPVSNTFHGRDIFAAIAGHASKGVSADKFGEVINDYVRLKLPQPRMEGNQLKGAVLKVDKFGNLITNITSAHAPALFGATPPKFTLKIGNATTTKLSTAYADSQPGELFAIVGSMGYLELAMNRASASQALGAGRSTEVTIEFL